VATLLATAFGRANIICVESSGRVSYGCEDVIPDELVVRASAPLQLGISTQECGFCHDYTVGHATTHSIEPFAAPGLAAVFQVLSFAQYNSIAHDLSFSVPIFDSSGNPPLKC
jgi:hypothetical protein